MYTSRIRQYTLLLPGLVKCCGFEKGCSESTCVSKDTIVDNFWAKWNSKAIENGFFGTSIDCDETILQNPLSTLLDCHQKNLCHSSYKCRGLEDDIEDLVSLVTNGYCVKLWAFAFFSCVRGDCKRSSHVQWRGMNHRYLWAIEHKLKWLALTIKSSGRWCLAMHSTDYGVVYAQPLVWKEGESTLSTGRARPCWPAGRLGPTL